MVRSPFDVNFRSLLLSHQARNQLGAIAESLTRHPDQRSSLVNDYILPNHYDEHRGLYLPLSSSPKLIGYITEDFCAVPTVIIPAEGSPLTLFGNALLLPKGWGNKGFDSRDAAAPRLRSTNIGFLVVTHEYDCETIDAFEQQLAWFRTDGAFKKVDAELRTYRDYLGYCITFSGRRSLHIHLVFNTIHLEHAPYDADRKNRLANQAMTSALMHKVHDVYWMTADEIISRILDPSLPSDPKLKSIVQWRRLPWGTRTLEKDSILGLSAGTAVPQLVIKEQIRQRAALGSTHWLVLPDFSTANPTAPPQRRGSAVPGFSSSGVDLIAELQSICRQDWGEYPKPVSLEQQKGEWVIRFKNHESDKTPSTIVAGDNRKLIMGGKNPYNQDFYLPDHLTAQQLGNHLASRFSGPLNCLSDGGEDETNLREPSPLERPSGPRTPFYEQIGRRIGARFPEPISAREMPTLAAIYREKLQGVVNTARMGIDYVIQSGEGIGKTTAHFRFLAEEALDAALSHEDNIQRFSCFAFRSHDQASEKSREYLSALGSKYQKTVHIQSFWQHYGDACRKLKEEAIPRDQFIDHSVNEVLKRICKEQPSVFSWLEEIRKGLWKSGFDAGSTMLFTTHATARLWHVSRITRIWSHPDFRPFDETQNHERLRGDFILVNVVFDEPELDELLHIIPEPLYGHLHSRQQEIPNWRNLSRHERESAFRRTSNRNPIAKIEFETYDELMRLDLTKLDQVKVDHDAIPFGNDNSPTGIYRAENGKTYYLSHRSWPFASNTHWAFLTTERLVTEVIIAIYRKRNRGLLPISIDNLVGIYPQRIPIYYDTRATKRKVTALAQEIVASNPNAIVISDGVHRSVERVLSFQKMKGHNGFADNDIYVIVTSLAPSQYAHLNVIGQWLNIPDIIGLHYQGIINQAVGRNSGFRQRDNTKTVVIASMRMQKVVPDAINRLRRRVILYRDDGKPW